MWLLWIGTAIKCAYRDYCSLIGQDLMHALIYFMRCSIVLLVCPTYVLAASSQRAPTQAYPSLDCNFHFI
jgi:hypothetical protein